MTTIFQFIDLRSFSDIWYWLMLALVWTRVMHAPMGVPADLVQRARRGLPGAAADLQALSDLNVRQERDAALALGAWRVAGWSFLLSSLGIAGFVYFVEIAQAAFLLLAPYGLVRLVVCRTAQGLAAAPAAGAALVSAHLRLRRRVQFVALPAVFLTAIWGMAHNIADRAIY